MNNYLKLPCQPDKYTIIFSTHFLSFISAYLPFLSLALQLLYNIHFPNELMNQHSFERIRNQDRNSKLQKPGNSATQSTSISPYQYLTVQLHIQEQRQNQSQVKQFQLQDPKESLNQTQKDKIFVIPQEEEENSRIDFPELNNKYSTIQYCQGASFQKHDVGSSDILIKQWLISSQHSEKKDNFSSFSYNGLPFYQYDRENKFEEVYNFKAHYLFDTHQSSILELDQFGCIKKMKRQEKPILGKRGILVTAKGRKK